MIIADILTNTRKFETKVQRLAEESRFLKRTSQGEQATQAFDMLLEMLRQEQLANPNYPSQPEKTAEQLAESLFWAVQSILRPDNKADREMLLSHDPDLKYVLAYLTLQPMAENKAGLSLHLYPRAAVLLKRHPLDPSNITMRASLDYENGGIQMVSDFIRLEIERRLGAARRIVGTMRLAENDTDRAAIDVALQNLQNGFDSDLKLLKSGQLPDSLMQLTLTAIEVDQSASQKKLRQFPLQEDGASVGAGEATA